MPRVHPTSVIETGAILADSVEIGPLCYVGPKVALGPGTRLVSHVALLGRTTLGRRNTVWPHCTIGGDPQDLKYRGEDTAVIIGDGNDIRENVTIHRGTAAAAPPSSVADPPRRNRAAGAKGAATIIGSHNLIMAGVHIAHDCMVGSHIVMANAVLLAGHVTVEDHVVLGGATAVHHFVTIGRFAFVGGMTRLVSDAPPFMITEGNPATVRGVNVVGLERHRMTRTRIERLKQAYRTLYHPESDDGEPVDPADHMAQGLRRLAARFRTDPCIRLLVQFIRRRAVGRYGRYRERHRRDNPREADPR